MARFFSGLLASRKEDKTGNRNASFEFAHLRNLPVPRLKQQQAESRAADGTFGWLLPSPFDTLVVNLSLAVHFRPFAVGSVYFSDVGFFLSVALLLLSVRALARR